MNSGRYSPPKSSIDTSAAALALPEKSYRRVALGILVAMMAAPGCGDSDAPKPSQPASIPDRVAADGSPQGRGRPGLIPARCPHGASNCRAATGRVVYVETVDPDGDGDLHVVLLDAASLSAPGITVLDVSRRLRPARDPAVGDFVTGAGPVYRGSFGQRQIQVTVFRAAR